MQTIQHLKAIPDDELLRRLAALLAGSRHTEADVVAHIGEVDARRLYAREATPSMFVYCLERLHLSEHEAYLRIAAARVSREHPAILDMLADGRLHLTAIALLAPHLTCESRDALLERATHKTKREVEEILAELAPRPDVPPSIRKLPLGRVVAATVRDRLPSAASRLLRPEQVDSRPLDEEVATTRGASLTPDSGAEVGASLGDTAPAASSDGGFAQRWAASQDCPSARIEPLSPRRYKVQFTASAELRLKLERLKALMRPSVPDGDLAAVIEAAVTEKLEKLEARRFGRVKARAGPCGRGQGEETVRPAHSEDAHAVSRSRYVPAEVRRSVYERDQGQCRYVDTQGRRCPARVYLEFHHGIPYAVGGEHSPSGMSVLCHAHNRLMATIDFGAGAVGSHRRGTASAPAAATEDGSCAS